MSLRPEVHLGQWSLAARSWSLHGSPLRPGEQDVDSYRQALTDWCDENPTSPPRALILGVTPEIYRLPWPKGASVTAVDRTPEMIEHVWPGPRSNALLSDWREVPLPERSVDLVFCDGGLHLLDFPDGQARLCGELERLILLVAASPYACSCHQPYGRLPRKSSTTLWPAPFPVSIPETALVDVVAGNANSGGLRATGLGAAALGGAKLVRVSCQARLALGARIGHRCLSRLSCALSLRDRRAGRTSDVRGTGGAFELDRVSIPSYAMGAQCPDSSVFRRTYKPREAL